MGMTKLGAGGFSLGRADGARLIKGGGVPAPYPPPAGYRWDYVTENNIRVTERNEPVVALVRAS